MISSNSESKFFFVKPSHCEKNTDLSKFMVEFDIFDDFYEFYSSITSNTVSHQSSNCFKDLVCSCYGFAKKRKCIHIYNFLRVKNLTSLIEFNILKIRKQRGRPKKIKRNAAFIKTD